MSSSSGKRNRAEAPCVMMTGISRRTGSLESNGKINSEYKNTTCWITYRLRRCAAVHVEAVVRRRKTWYCNYEIITGTIIRLQTVVYHIHRISFKPKGLTSDKIIRRTVTHRDTRTRKRSKKQTPCRKNTEKKVKIERKGGISRLTMRDRFGIIFQK